ncbi:hypothetical protein [Teredinibacter turnerae]|uniref:hypothetical protein n=1 Tax=Teredinibacter turnerae TaxID=2426 RepID=UPI0030CFBF7E
MATVYGNPTLSTLEIATSLAVTAGQPYFFCARVKFPLPSVGDSSLNVSGPLVLMAGNQEKLNTLLPKSDATVRSYFPNTGATVQIAGSDVLQDPAVFADYIGVYDPSAGASGQCSLYINGVLAGGVPQDFPAGESIPEGPLKVVLNCYQEDGKDWEIEDLYCGFAVPSAQDVADFGNGLVPNGDGSAGWQSGLTAGLRASLTGSGYLGGHVTESGHTVDHDTIASGTAEGEANAPLLGGSPAPANTLSNIAVSGVLGKSSDISIDSDTAAGTLFCVCTSSAAQPSAAQIALGQDESGAAAVAADLELSPVVGANALALSGLAINTSYYVHAVQDRDDAGDYSNVVSASFSTLRVGFKSAPEVRYADGTVIAGLTGVDAVFRAAWDGDALQVVNDVAVDTSIEYACAPGVLDLGDTLHGTLRYPNGKMQPFSVSLVDLDV